MEPLPTTGYRTRTQAKSCRKSSWSRSQSPSTGCPRTPGSPNLTSPKSYVVQLGSPLPQQSDWPRTSATLLNSGSGYRKPTILTKPAQASTSPRFRGPASTTVSSPPAVAVGGEFLVAGYVTRDVPGPGRAEQGRHRGLLQRRGDPPARSGADACRPGVTGAAGPVGRRGSSLTHAELVLTCRSGTPGRPGRRPRARRAG